MSNNLQETLHQLDRDIQNYREASTGSVEEVRAVARGLINVRHALQIVHDELIVIQKSQMSEMQLIAVPTRGKSSDQPVSPDDVFSDEDLIRYIAQLPTTMESPGVAKDYLMDNIIEACREYKTRRLL